MANDARFTESPLLIILQYKRRRVAKYFRFFKCFTNFPYDSPMVSPWFPNASNIIPRVFLWVPGWFLIGSHFRFYIPKCFCQCISSYRSWEEKPREMKHQETKFQGKEPLSLKEKTLFNQGVSPWFNSYCKEEFPSADTLRFENR